VSSGWLRVARDAPILEARKSDTAARPLASTRPDRRVAAGCAETIYAPRMEMRCDQTASFLVRLLPVTMQTG
jgi:hypothetical protein